jgi:multiple antibiotic resistance protein
MPAVIESFVRFVAILNPFALCLYLTSVMDELASNQFAKVLLRACIISLTVFWFFGLTGESLLIAVLNIRPEALRVFGGAVFFVVAYNYIVKGARAAQILRGSLDELPSAIAVPFMIGAGTITQAILVGKNCSAIGTIVVLFVRVLLSFFVVLAFKFLKERITGDRERVFERYVNILTRLNGLLIGAISTEMIVSGIGALWAAI